MKWVTLLAFLAGILFSFQNCGETRGTDVLAEGEQAFDSSQQCAEDGTCLERHDLIWMMVREYSPYKVQYTALQAGHFTVGGVCGIGAYTNHSFLWELNKSFGDQATVGQGFSDNLCINGRFSIPITNNLGIVDPDQRYILHIELVGIQDNGAQVSNPQPTNRGTLDVIFTSGSL